MKPEEAKFDLKFINEAIKEKLINDRLIKLEKAIEPACKAYTIEWRISELTSKVYDTREKMYNLKPSTTYEGTMDQLEAEVFACGTYGPPPASLVKQNNDLRDALQAMVKPKITTKYHIGDILRIYVQACRHWHDFRIDTIGFDQDFQKTYYRTSGMGNRIFWCDEVDADPNITKVEKPYGSR